MFLAWKNAALAVSRGLPAAPGREGTFILLGGRAEQMRMETIEGMGDSSGKGLKTGDIQGEETLAQTVADGDGGSCWWR